MAATDLEVLNLFYPIYPALEMGLDRVEFFLYASQLPLAQIVADRFGYTIQQTPLASGSAIVDGQRVMLSAGAFPGRDCRIEFLKK